MTYNTPKYNQYGLPIKQRKTTTNPLKRKPNEALSIYILKLAGIGVLFTAASILSPYFLLGVLKAYLHYKFSEPTRKDIHNSLNYLKRKKFIAFEKHGSKLKLVLTKLGRKRISQVNLTEIKIKPAKWDGQWRLLTFDIPEGEVKARHSFRRKLKELGFFHFQRSVFILPYPCEQEINQVTEILNISPYVHLITGQRFASDKALIKKFGL